MKLTAHKVKDLDAVALRIKEFLLKTETKIVVLEGEMGAGKTTLINLLLSLFDVEDHTSSPTFSIVNEYFSVNYGTIYHFDFYRIEDETEALDIGVEELFDDDAYCFIEWPDKVSNLLPDKIVRIDIKLQGTTRQFEVSEP